MYLQDGNTPLDWAVQYNKIDIVHFFIKNCNPDISKLKQVCNCVALFLNDCKKIIQIFIDLFASQFYILYTR